MCIWADLDLALGILAVDPEGVGGLWLRARAGPTRDIASAAIVGCTFDRPLRRLSAGIDDIALLGGLDPAATLARGQPVWRDGLLTHPAILVLPMAEAAPPSLVARLAQARDRGQHALIALDEAAEEGEGLASALSDRIGLFICLDGARPPEDHRDAVDGSRILAARERLPSVTFPPEAAEALVRLAGQLGITSDRAVILCLRIARAIAALAGRRCVSADDLAKATALGLAHRATCAPSAEDAPEPPPADSPDPPPDADTSDPTEAEALADRLIEAAAAALPPDLLSRLAAERAARSARGTSGTGAAKAGNRRGRPLPSRPGRPDGRSRIDLVATLRAAAPWQVFRRREAGNDTTRALLVRPEDLRLRRFREVSDRVLIFVVDASGSSAIARLAEAKGAVELLLAQAYSRRDHVALIVVRGSRAELALAPTRSLVQTKHRLRGLPGGGGTPLASGLSVALTCALRARRQGMSPSLAILTDGRGNIALDGRPDRARAQADAEAAADAIRRAGLGGVVLDVATRPQAPLADLARRMDNRYLPLPRADAHRIAAALADG